MANTEKEFQSRITHKHDIEANWIKAVNFIPKAGELIIYDKDESYNYERLKLGDGINKINDLPFLIFAKIENWQNSIAPETSLLSNLTINVVKDQQVFQEMSDAGLIDAQEIYLIQDLGTSPEGGGSSITIENWTSSEAEPLKTELNQLTINTIKNIETYEAMKEANLIDENELYLVQDEGIKVTSHLNSGIKIATITINGIDTDIYAPAYTYAEEVGF